MKSTLIQTTLAAAISIMSATTLSAAETIRIAMLEPLSGAAAVVGTSTQKHLQFFIDRLNADGGINGKDLELVSFDNKAKPDESLVILQDVVSQGIQYIYQNTSSAVGAALLAGVDKHNRRNPGKPILFLNGGSTEPSLTNEKCSYWFFRFFPHTKMLMRANIGLLAQNQNIKKVYLLNQDYSYGKSVSAAAKEYLAELRPDIEIVGDEFVPLQTVKDFSPYAVKVRSSGADAIISGNWGGDLSLMIRGIKEAGLDVDFYTFFAGAFGSPSAIGGAGIGSVFETMNYHPSLAIEKDLPGLEADYLALKDRFDVDMWYYHHSTMFTALKQAMEQIGSEDPAKVAAAMEGMTIETALGTATINADDHQLHQPLYVAVYDGDQKYDIEGSGIGWKTLMELAPEETVVPHTCNMKRP